MAPSSPSSPKARPTSSCNLTHYLSGHGEWEYDLEQGQSTQFQKPEFHLYAGGALSSIFSFYVDANGNNDYEALYLQMTKEQGSETYFTARAGKISPTMIRNYGNGLMASASRPLILTDATLADNPFTPARDSFGVDVAARWKALYFQAGVVNGEDVPGQAAVSNHKDFFATAEAAMPDGLSGIVSTITTEGTIWEIPRSRRSSSTGTSERASSRTSPETNSGWPAPTCSAKTGSTLSPTARSTAITSKPTFTRSNGWSRLSATTTSRPS
jgi:hypothetical protein